MHHISPVDATALYCESVQRTLKNAWSIRLAFVTLLTSDSLQDNQTDSGMVLASEEFERIENRHRKEGTFRYLMLISMSYSP